MAMHASKKFITKGGQAPSTGIFEQLPIKIKNSHLVQGLLLELESKRADSADTDFSGALPPLPPLPPPFPPLVRGVGLPCARGRILNVRRADARTVALHWFHPCGTTDTGLLPRSQRSAVSHLND